MKISCPRCDSSNTQPLHIVYSQGTYTGSSVTNSYGISTSGNVINSVGVGSHSGSSLLAQQVAPPKKPKNSLVECIISGIVSGGFGYFLIYADKNSDSYSNKNHLLSSMGWVFILLAICVIIFGIVQGLSAYEKMPDYSREYENWSKKRVCFACGTVYTPNMSTSVDFSRNSESEVFDKTNKSNSNLAEELDYSEKIAKLRQASELLKDNLISKEEFDKIKDKLIG